MNPLNAVSGTNPLGEAQILMLRTAMDMALQRNQTLLAAMPAPPGAAAAGAGGHVDRYA